MKNKKITNKRRKSLLVFTVLCLLVSSLMTNSAVAQSLITPLKGESTESTGKALDLAALPSSWWAQLNTGSAEEVNQRFDEFLLSLEQRVSGLVDDELVTANNGIAHLRSGFELLVLARKGPTERHFEPPLSKESYLLDDVLNLRAEHRKLELKTAQAGLQIEQLGNQIYLLQDRRDKLISEYESENPEAPARMLTGIKRITAMVEYELALERIKNSKEFLKRIEAQSLLVNGQIEFARTHLVSDDVTLDDLQKAALNARVKVNEEAQKVSLLQLHLLEVLSAEKVNSSLELLRKQQLTRATAEAKLAELQELLLAAKTNWYQLRADKLELGFDLRNSMVDSRRKAADSLRQAELWSSVSQATLTAPSYDTSLNTVKNFEIAQSVARDTLAVIDEIKSTSDNLTIIQDILTNEIIVDRKGVVSVSARLGLIFGHSWDRLVHLADYHLFTIGDTVVTPAGLFKMLMILGLAIGVSWLIRKLLARGISKKRTAQSPAFYTLGRILHYIIIMAGSFAALGSIGIDFTSFALIAGALSVGIGFGLQAIVSNFVSGLILLFEGTLRVGDFIEMDGELRGVVKEINTRATVINTNDGVDLVVPNSELVTTQLTNWTLRESYGRLRVSFGVAYGSDKELVKTLALEAIGKVDWAITHMPGLEPQVRLSNFGDSSLDFTVLFWVSRQGVRRPGRTRASFLWEIETLLRENDVEIPFPQRDLHVRSDFRENEEAPLAIDSPQD